MTSLNKEEINLLFINPSSRLSTSGMNPVSAKTMASVRKLENKGLLKQARSRWSVTAKGKALRKKLV